MAHVRCTLDAAMACWTHRLAVEQDISGIQSGPMIVEEPDTTVVVPPGWSVSLDAYSNLALSKVA